MEASISAAQASDRTASASNTSRRGNLLRAAVAELIGTYFLVLVGTAVATAAYLHKNTAGPAYDSLSIAMAFGLILIPLIGAIGKVSGAHVNPAVTLGLAAIGRFPWKALPAYWTAQLFGGIAASLTVWGAYGNRAYLDAHLGAPGPAHGSSDLQVLVTEALIACILVFTVAAVTTDKRVPASIAPLTVGFALTAGVLLGGPVSGGAGNPARALGPMLVTQSCDAWYVYVLGPLIGGVVGAFLFNAVRSGEPPATDAPRPAETSDAR